MDHRNNANFSDGSATIANKYPIIQTIPLTIDALLS